jgi:fructuronate reductase
VSTLRRTTAGPPIRAVHLGLGSFFRAHQAWYTDRAADGEDCGIAAFTGRSRELADALTAQDGLYTLITRAAGGDEFSVVRSVPRAHAAADSEAWLGYLASPDVRVVTLTVTEAGYATNAADLEALRADRHAAVGSVPARLVAGLLARRRADAGPLTLVPCDNLADNGRVLETALRDAVAAVDPTLQPWLENSVSTVTTMVDRITPEPTEADRRAVLHGTGVEDRCPVATEPFSEWVLSGGFPGGRPAWETAGAVITDDIAPFENRKLWLLNGAHSLLAYAGSVRGHATVADAVADPRCLGWVQSWWNTCAPHLDLPVGDVAAYRAALLDRFANPRMRHALAQIATDGSQKLPVRLLPVLRLERRAGRLPDAAAIALAAWVLHLRGAGAPVRDVRAHDLVLLAAGPLRQAVPRVLAALEPGLADDAELVATVRARCGDLLAG